ncbi:GNAT family N-acetyltransferase [Roseibium aestuarii]|uniref:GNAT family N-acetyltransferase n=1 Tax=Roseibium aestuarii TaxID=2600299 RepID=A0ABW4K3B8_9HYPH|nr:GNAT family N-acetyltransferase [Roseibium aestuarii]
MILETERLILRPWKDADLDPLAAMSVDPEVMRYFFKTRSRDEARVMMDRAIAKTEADGICFCPVELKATGAFIGFTGLSRPAYDKPLPFDPCVEVGWSLMRSAWGQGYASEAARAWLGFGFETLGLEEIVSFTAASNVPSQRVMQRLGMVRRAEDDFAHPMVPEDHPLAPHVLYRLTRAAWQASRSD